MPFAFTDICTYLKGTRELAAEHVMDVDYLTVDAWTFSITRFIKLSLFPTRQLFLGVLGKPYNFRARILAPSWQQQKYRHDLNIGDWWANWATVSVYGHLMGPVEPV